MQVTPEQQQRIDALCHRYRVRQLRLFGLIEMMVFMALLVTGYVYLLRRGALDWE